MPFRGAHRTQHHIRPQPTTARALHRLHRASAATAGARASSLHRPRHAFAPHQRKHRLRLMDLVLLLLMLDDKRRGHLWPPYPLAFVAFTLMAWTGNYVREWGWGTVLPPHSRRPRPYQPTCGFTAQCLRKLGSSLPRTLSAQDWTEQLRLGSPAKRRCRHLCAELSQTGFRKEQSRITLITVPVTTAPSPSPRISGVGLGCLPFSGLSFF